MADCDWAIICEHGFQDIGTRPCMTGIFDRIFVPAVPAALAFATLIAKVLGNPGEKFRFKVEVLRQSGGPLVAVNGEMTVSETGAAYILGNFINLPLPELGLYAVNTYINDDAPKSTTFVVQDAPKAQRPPA
jgi:hypothetical protein